MTLTAAPSHLARPSRRTLLSLGAGGLALTLPGARAAIAAQPLERKLVFVILRGGLDGLAAVPPFGDPAVRRHRAALLPPEPGEPGGARALSDGFALHPSLRFMHDHFAAGEAAVLHAAATPYRARSHFDGQDILESGGATVFGLDDGWLNRALTAHPNAPEAIAVGDAVPLALRGPAKVGSWSPNVLPEASQDTLARLQTLYQADPALAAALGAAIEVDEMAGDMGAPGRRRGRRAAFEPIARAAGRLLAQGAGLSMISFGGWDTHASQGAGEGQLAARLALLDEALAALKEELGPHWANTAVIVATEFGRTVRVNGTRGTDHGTGGAAFVLGGAVAGGRLLGDWPGLQRLHEDRDLIPANDLRALFKGVLAGHWGLDEAVLGARVFPGSAALAPMRGLIV